MSIVYGRRYDTGELCAIHIEHGLIQHVVPAWTTGRATDWPFVAPGLFDIQINGHSGIWYSHAGLTSNQVLQTLTAYFAHGVTRLCPTLITAGHDALAAGFAALREACEQVPWAGHMVPGFHLEGPFISPEDGPRGAHPLEHVRPADWDEFCQLQEIAGGRIKLVTLAPESPNAVAFIRRAVASGVVISIGHTAATRDQIQAAVDAGAALSTHLGNGAHGMMRRHPNYIWEQLGEPRLYASIIPDGHHLPASVVNAIVKTKTPYRTILTCDASGLAGCQSGFYELGSGRFELLPDGRIVIAGQQQLLAGSSLATDTCIASMIKMSGVSLRDAIDMATRTPARLLDQPQFRLQRGSRADLFLFRLPPDATRLDVVATIACGEVRYGSIAV
ncbi:MAG: nagA [Planctomycetaceae bacterium]|nr:nagA [Planctomycetaceae bacterium]